MAKAKTRPYSRDFTPPTAKRVTLVIDRIPPNVRKQAKAKAHRAGLSLRALVLGWLVGFIRGDIEPYRKDVDPHADHQSDRPDPG